MWMRKETSVDTEWNSPGMALQSLLHNECIRDTSCFVSRHDNRRTCHGPNHVAGEVETVAPRDDDNDKAASCGPLRLPVVHHGNVARTMP